MWRAKLAFSRDLSLSVLRGKSTTTFLQTSSFFFKVCDPVNGLRESETQGKLDLDLLNFLKIHLALNSGQNRREEPKRFCINKMLNLRKSYLRMKA